MCHQNEPVNSLVFMCKLPCGNMTCIEMLWPISKVIMHSTEVSCRYNVLK